VSVCLPVQTVTHNTHAHNTKNKGKHVFGKSTLALKHSIPILGHEKHTVTQAMKARQKRQIPGRTTDCSANKAACIEEKQRVRQPAVMYTE
jgi:hypothetical protein